MLKVAVITRYFPSSAEPWQGRSAYQTLRVLARTNEVKVFFPNAVYPSFLTPRSRAYDHLDTAFRPPEVDVNYFNYPALPLISRPFNGWMAAHALLPHVRKFAPDVLHSFFIYPEGYAALLIGKALKIPVVAKGLGSDINRIADPLTRRNTRKVLREADFLFTVSEDLRRKSIAMGAKEESSRTLINGCDLSVFKVRDRIAARAELQMAAETEAVVYIGRMDTKKGLVELVDAAASLHAQRPNMHVYMVGEGPDRSIVESAIESHNASGYIHALQSCHFDVVPIWMAAADLVTLPSYMEGCPNVVLEALASGRPVVATNVGGIPEIMNEQCGILVPPRESAPLAQAINAVLNKSWNADDISSQRSRSWETVAGELHDVFDSVLASYRVKHAAK